MTFETAFSSKNLLSILLDNRVNFVIEDVVYLLSLPL